MGGGIIVLNESLEEKIRTFVKEAPIGDLKVRSWMREVITNSVNPKISSNHSLFLSSAYELLTQFVEPNAIDFSGFPTSIEGIQHIGSERSLRVNLILNFLEKSIFQNRFSKPLIKLFHSLFLAFSEPIKSYWRE